MRFGMWAVGRIRENTGQQEEREVREPREDWKCGLKVAATILEKDMEFVEEQWEQYLDQQCDQARRRKEVWGLGVIRQTLDIREAKEE
jgi:hypothetical protein